MKIVLIVAITTIFALTSADIVSESLAAHSKYRAPLGIPDLTWSSSLAQTAQAWADNLAQTQSSSHSPNRNGVGENIAWGSRGGATRFVDMWGEEQENFIPGRNYPDCGSDTGHYTQMVWEKTTEVGCGLAVGSGRQYFVCQYSPAGNRRGDPVYTSSGQSQESTTEMPEDSVFEEPQRPDESSAGNRYGQPVHTSSGQSYEPQRPEESSAENRYGQPVHTSSGQSYEPTTEMSEHPVFEEPQRSEESDSGQNYHAGNMMGQPVFTNSGETQDMSFKRGNPNEQFEDPAQEFKESASEPEQDSLISESLAAHHYWRSAVGVHDLVWNATLAKSAQAWADYLATTKRISHSKDRVNTGENLAYGTANTNDVESFVGLWGEESEYFVAGRIYPKCTRGSESDVWHYTQLIWRKTTQLGCGMGKSDGRLYYVCQYYPRGNMLGQPVL